MSRLFPFKASRDQAPEPWVLALDEESANEVFDALSSETSRMMLQSLYSEPQTASELAAHADTSLQNVRYHLDKFEDANLVESVGEAYSKRGNEMTVYAPRYDPLILAASSEERTQPLQRVLKRLLGAVGILAVFSVIIDQLLKHGLPNLGAGNGGDGGAATGQTPTPSLPPDFALDISPGLLVFLGGLFVVILVGVWVYNRRRVDSRS